MFIRILAAPFVLGLLVLLYFSWEVDSSHAKWIAIPVIALVALYILSPQINWWWSKKHPPALAAPIVQLIKQNKWFTQLTPEIQKKFLHRLGRYMIGVDFKPMGEFTIPEDIKAICASCAVQVSFKHEDFIMAPFEHIVIYNHGFPSPQYPRQRHHSEIYEPDGVIMFSAPHLLKGYLEPEHYLNLGLYEYIRVFIETNISMAEKKPKISDEDIKSISNYDVEAFKKQLGLRVIDKVALMGVFYFQIPDNLMTVRKDVFAYFEEYF